MSRLSPVIGSARMGVVYGTERPIDRLRKPIALRDTQMHRERRSARGLVSGPSAADLDGRIRRM